MRYQIITFVESKSNGATYSELWQEFGHGSRTTFTAFLKSREYLIQKHYRGNYFVNQDHALGYQSGDVLPFID